jgi:hypothetical protein
MNAIKSLASTLAHIARDTSFVLCAHPQWDLVILRIGLRVPLDPKPHPQEPVSRHGQRPQDFHQCSGGPPQL